ncbi:MAG: tripartite tricarboxylate transporter TctB family protein [Alphaproteobacteria bacterium]|nr:tripartite tricarboxylate transporter TctB family protein [Alphaproteobacteria bacterium]
MALRNIVAAATLLALGIAYGYLATQLPERSQSNLPGPAFFPYLIAVLLLALSLGLLVQGVRGYRRLPLDLGLPERASAILALLLFAAYLVALPRLGFLIASIPFAGGMMWLYGGRNPLFLVAGAAGLPLFLLLLFREVFGILLPHGSWSVLGG